MKLKVGKRVIKQGQMVCLARNGTLRCWKNQFDQPIGVATTELKRDTIAELVEGTTGNWADMSLLRKGQFSR